jgi:hypothetical protein
MNVRGISANTAEAIWKVAVLTDGVEISPLHNQNRVTLMCMPGCELNPASQHRQAEQIGAAIHCSPLFLLTEDLARLNTKIRTIWRDSNYGEVFRNQGQKSKYIYTTKLWTIKTRSTARWLQSLLVDTVSLWSYNDSFVGHLSTNQANVSVICIAFLRCTQNTLRY